MSAPDATLAARWRPESAVLRGTVQADVRFLALGLLFGVVALKNSLVPLLGFVGLGAMLAVAVIGVINCLRAPFPARLLAVFLPLFAAYSLSILLVPSAAAAKTYGQLVAVMLVFLLGWRIGAHPALPTALRAVQKVLLGFAVVGVACAFLFRDSDHYVFANPNTAGAFAFTGAIANLLERARAPDTPVRRRNLVLLVFAALVVASSARAALLGMVVASAIFLAWRYVTRTRARFWGVFLAAAFVIASGTWLLAQFGPGLEMYEALRDASQEYTGKNVGTRTAVWSVAIPDIEARPWLGWGLGRQAGDNPYGNPDLSCHSQYIELGIKTGYVGIASLVMALASVWALAWRARARPEARVTAALLLGLSFHQMFEVNLLQVGLPLGMLWWLQLGVGVRASIEDRAAPPPLPSPERALTSSDRS